MKNTRIILKKELLNYFTQPMAYVFAGALILISSWFFWQDIFIIGMADMSSYWSTMSWLLSLLVPAIAMNLIAEEKKANTWEILKSSPVSEKEVVWGKFWASAIYLLSCLLLSIPTIILLYFAGSPQMSLIIGGFLGIAMMSLSYLSLGLMMSSIFNSSVLAFIFTSLLLIINNLTGQDYLLSKVSPFFKNILTATSLSFRSAKFGSGLLDVGDFVFFVSFIVICLNVSVMVLKGREK